MTSVLSDREDRLVAHLVENELSGMAAGSVDDDEEYREELEELLEKLRG